MIIVSGWIDSDLFIIYGESKLELICCIIVMIIIMSSVWIGEVNSVMIIVGVVLMNGLR